MYNPITADYFDDTEERRQDEIERVANLLMDDPDWVACQFEDGLVEGEGLFNAIAGKYVPNHTHALVGGLLIEILWKLAIKQATKDVDDGPADYDGE